LFEPSITEKQTGFSVIANVIKPEATDITTAEIIRKGKED